MRTMFMTMAIIVLLAVSACSITKPMLITNVPMTKIGRTTQTGIFFFPPWAGDNRAGIYMAAKKAGITQVATVDYRVSWYVLFTTWEIIVTGQ